MSGLLNETVDLYPRTTTSHPRRIIDTFPTNDSSEESGSESDNQDSDEFFEGQSGSESESDDDRRLYRSDDDEEQEGSPYNPGPDDEEEPSSMEQDDAGEENDGDEGKPTDGSSSSDDDPKLPKQNKEPRNVIAQIVEQEKQRFNDLIIKDDEPIQMAYNIEAVKYIGQEAFKMLTTELESVVLSQALTTLGGLTPNKMQTFLYPTSHIGNRDLLDRTIQPNIEGASYIIERSNITMSAAIGLMNKLPITRVTLSVIHPTSSSSGSRSSPFEREFNEIFIHSWARAEDVPHCVDNRTVRLHCIESLGKINTIFRRQIENHNKNLFRRIYGDDETEEEQTTYSSEYTKQKIVEHDLFDVFGMSKSPLQVVVSQSDELMDEIDPSTKHQRTTLCVDFINYYALDSMLNAVLGPIESRIAYDVFAAPVQIPEYHLLNMVELAKQLYTRLQLPAPSLLGNLNKLDTREKNSTTYHAVMESEGVPQVEVTAHMINSILTHPLDPKKIIIHNGIVSIPSRGAKGRATLNLTPVPVVYGYKNLVWVHPPNETPRDTQWAFAKETRSTVVIVTQPPLVMPTRTEKQLPQSAPQYIRPIDHFGSPMNKPYNTRCLYPSLRTRTGQTAIESFMEYMGNYHVDRAEIVYSWVSNIDTETATMAYINRSIANDYPHTQKPIFIPYTNRAVTDTILSILKNILVKDVGGGARDSLTKQPKTIDLSIYPTLGIERISKYDLTMLIFSRSQQGYWFPLKHAFTKPKKRTTFE